jgi:hypothetical protein
LSDSNGNGSTPLLRCPTCRAKVVVQRADGEIVLFQRVVVVRAGRVYATCSQCRTEVLVEAMAYASQSVIVEDSHSHPSGDLTLRVESGTVSPTGPGDRPEKP